MPATRQARASHQTEVDEEPKRLAPEQSDESQADGKPVLPALDAGHLEPEDWLALQKTIGNSAVGGLVERRRYSQPLPAQARRDMEASFGQDFGDVQLHSGPEVDKAAQALDAAAFTVGQDIYVDSDLPSFDDPAGRQVLGEELAHVAQGVGRRGLDRLTAPDETAERQAHAAGAAAATGQRAKVEESPETASAVARFDLKKLYDWATGGDETAKKVEKTELSDDEKARLNAGALTPLNSYWAMLGDQSMAAKDGKQSNDKLRSIAINADGIADFILGFNGPAAVQPTIQAAGAAAINGRQALLGAIDPAAATKASGPILTQIGNEISAIAGAPQPAAAPGAGSAPGATPAPAAAPAPDANAETLSAAEADQLKSGAAEPLKSIGQQLGGDAPDMDVLLTRLKGVPGVLRSFSKPAAVAAQLRQKAMEVDGQISRLEAAKAGPEGAIGMAMSQWGTAINLLQGLTAQSAAGGATPGSAGAAQGSSDDHPQDNHPPD